MYTTRKFIFDSSEIDQLDGFKKEINTVTIKALQEGPESGFVIKKYTINEFGSISSCLRTNIKRGWTAYPPLIDSDEGEAINELNIIDKYQYSPLENLLKIETFKIEEEEDGPVEKKIKTKHFEYNKNLIVGEKIPGDQIIYSRKKDGKITLIEQTKSLNSFSEAFIQSEFIYNKENQITEKNIKHRTIVGDQSIIVNAKTNFFYNENNQLSSSFSKIKFGEDLKELSSKFTYVNDQDELIESIEYYDKSKLTKSIQYTFDELKRLTRKVEESSEKEKQILEYIYS